MFLIRRANILPRRASTTAFLCLVVAHLEWPLMPSYLNSCFGPLVSWPDESTWTTGGGWPAARLPTQDSHVSQEIGGTHFAHLAATIAPTPHSNRRTTQSM